MTCREFTEFLADYLAGELPEPRLRVFEQHLAVCPDCANYLASYCRTIELGKAAFLSDDAEIPREVPEGLIQAVLKARGSAC